MTFSNRDRSLDDVLDQIAGRTGVADGSLIADLRLADRRVRAATAAGKCLSNADGSSRGSTSSLTPRKRAVLIYYGYCYRNAADAELRILGCVSSTASRWRHHSSGQGREWLRLRLVRHPDQS